jgi:hypothetical protein
MQLVEAEHGLQASQIEVTKLKSQHSLV